LSHDKLLEEWNDLLKRRPTFREPLAVYRVLLESWARPSKAEPRPLTWTAHECEDRWEREVPLLSEASLSISSADIEDRLEASLEILRQFGGQEDAIQRFAHAWDTGEIGPQMLLPTRGRIGAARLWEVVAASPDVIAFLACGALRPALDAYFADCRSHLTDRLWILGVCPFCGAPPGFADVAEGGQRRLACHLCGGGWVFPRLQCPFCGHQTAKDLVRLDAGATEEGYFISACRQCHGYVKELDRRVRWNAGAALIEDWGSPHLDLVAVRAGYWRPIPSLIQLARSG
jgi:Protein involved in formate dehydrogenase formation